MGLATGARRSGTGLGTRGLGRLFLVREWCCPDRPDRLADRILVNGPVPAGSDRALSTISMPQVCNFINASIANLQFFSPELPITTADKKSENYLSRALDNRVEPS